LVVLAGVDGEVAEELAGDGVDDSDVEALDEQDDVGSFVWSFAGLTDVSRPATRDGRVRLAGQHRFQLDQNRHPDDRTSREDWLACR
jgi:hypothetical protein